MSLLGDFFFFKHWLWGTWVPPSVEHVTLDLGIVNSKPHVEDRVYFFNCSYEEKHQKFFPIPLHTYTMFRLLQ